MNDLKHTRKWAKDFFRHNNIDEIEWIAQYPGFNKIPTNKISLWNVERQSVRLIGSGNSNNFVVSLLFYEHTFWLTSEICNFNKRTQTNIVLFICAGIRLYRSIRKQVEFKLNWTHLWKHIRFSDSLMGAAIIINITVCILKPNNQQRVSK